MSRPLRRWIAVAATGLCLGTHFAAKADDLADAKRWVTEGDAAEAAHDYPTAISKYQLALGVKRTAQLYLRLGLAQEESGNLADAMRSYESAAPLAAGNDAALSLVSKQIEKLRPKIGYVALSLPSAPASVRVTVNDAPVNDLAAEAPVNPGDVVVHATAPDRVDFSKKVHVGAGEHAKVEVTLAIRPTNAPNPAPTPAAPPPTATHPSIAGIVLLAVGIVGIGAGAGVLGQGFVYQSQLDTALAGKCPKMNGAYVCPAGTMVMVDGEPAADISTKSNVFKGAGGATMGVGAALGIVGGVLLGLSLRSHDGSSAQVTPILGPTAVGAAYSQRF